MVRMLQQRGCTRLLLRAEEGVTAIDFAIIAPVFLLMLFGILEFAFIMLAANVMESATSISSRLGKTGYANSGVTREQTIINSIKQYGSSFINSDLVTITSKAYKQFDQINDPEPFTDGNGNSSYDAGESYTDINGNGQWDADMGVAGYGGAGDIVVYTVHYPWSISTPMMSALVGVNGEFPITARAVVKNEPY